MLGARKLEIAITIAVVVLDQVTKAMVRPALALHESVPVIPGLLDLTRVHNTGAAFGMLNAVDFPMKTLVLSLVAMIALGGVAWYAVAADAAGRAIFLSTKLSSVDAAIEQPDGSFEMTTVAPLDGATYPRLAVAPSGEALAVWTEPSSSSSDPQTVWASTLR